MTTRDSKRLDEAAEWMLRLQGDNTDSEAIADWVRWCEADERNQQSFDKVQELWQLTLSLGREVKDGELIGVSSATRRRVAGFSSRKWLWPIVAGIAALALLSWLRFGAVANNSLIAAHKPVQSATLPDGSRVELASKSTVAVRYTDSARVLELRGGEAWFSVAPNKQKPFIVRAGNVNVRALGTAFNVRRAGDRVVVAVTEGLVEVERSGGSSRARVSAGKQLAVTAETRMTADTAVTSVDSAAVLAWREGRLEYVGEPLEAVIIDINRYAKRPVIIADEAAKKLRFSGTVMIDYTNEWVRALPGEFPLQVQEQNGVDVIQSRSAP